MEYTSSWTGVNSTTIRSCDNTKHNEAKPHFTCVFFYCHHSLPLRVSFSSIMLSFLWLSIKHKVTCLTSTDIWLSFQRQITKSIIYNSFHMMYGVHLFINRCKFNYHTIMWQLPLAGKIKYWEKIETVTLPRTDNTMAKRKSAKGQTTIDKTYI
jgi:hypothetical protein